MQQHQFPDAGASISEQPLFHPVPEGERDTRVPGSGIYTVGTATGGGACLACGSIDVSIIGERPDAPERLNACCEHCGLLQVTGPVTFEGTSLADSRIDGASAHTRAGRIALGANVKMGDAVLGFGAYGAQLLGELDALFGIDAHVVVDPARPVALPANAIAFADDVRLYEPGIRFDAILAFHVAQRWPAPLQTFIHLRHQLKLSGMLLVEVPNVLPDGEFDIDTFLGAGTTSSFSFNTLRVVLLRAGFHVDAVRNDDTIVLACRQNAGAARLPLPFRPEMLQSPEQTGDWLLTRLATYVAAEQARDEIVAGATSAPSARAFLELLRQPAFNDHLVNVTIDVVQAYAEAGELATARCIAEAASLTLPEQYRAGFGQMMAALD